MSQATSHLENGEELGGALQNGGFMGRKWERQGRGDCLGQEHLPSGMKGGLPY